MNLNAVEAHAAVDVLVLRYLPVLVERLLPGRRRDSGGTTPMIGCHSVMERPEPVSRVAPPTLTSANTSAATANSHTRTGSTRRAASASTGGLAG